MSSPIPPTRADSAKSSGVSFWILLAHAIPPFFKKACVDSCWDARTRREENMCSVTQSPANRLISGPESLGRTVNGALSVLRSYSISSRTSMQHIHSRSVSGVSRSGYRFPASPKRHNVGRAIVQMRQSQYDKGMDPRGCRKCASVPELLPAQSPCGEACHSCWPVAVFWSSNCSRCFSLRR